MYKRVLAVLAAVLLVAGCGGPAPQRPEGPTSSQAEKKAQAEPVTIEGDEDLDVNQLAAEAIGDLQVFWEQEYSKLYEDDYKPVDGGFYGSTSESQSGPECAANYGEVEGRAFFCRLDDSITWDAETFMPELREQYGDFVVPVVLAHEFGHAMQQRSGFFDQNQLTVSSELQADCFAGAWSRHAEDDDVFSVTTGELDTSLAGLIDAGDALGTDTMDQGAHGSGFDRASAFQDGFDNGLEKCKQYEDGEPPLLNLPFTSAQDAANQGDQPYDSTINSVPFDLEDYWTRVYPELNNGVAWEPVKGLVPFDPASPPLCGGRSAASFALFYCQPDDYVGWDNVHAMPAVYDVSGDWGVATLLATQYGLAVLFRMNAYPEDEKTATLRGDCLAGAYTASVILFNRQDTSSLRISPGDLDEGITALLIARGEGDVERQGSGFDRARAFREGVINGAAPCISYEA